MSKINISKSAKNKIAAGLIALTITTSALTLSGCGNQQVFDTKYTFNKAITIKDGVATIYDVEKWRDYEGEQIQLVLVDGTVVLTSSFDTKLFNTDESDCSIEDIARSYVGENGEIIYFGKTSKVK